ncbi:predicted protein [Botrytis cinerea T4]|uniref:Uncharacterized protein n=1 Tax=Botryotinia fuckeliana (strain T4) TaxID=999810 RepID=G2YBE7_BOTF4|nr:predicted protein [Botrytis cinerea T4]
MRLQIDTNSKFPCIPSSAFVTYKSTHGEQAPDPLPRQATDTQVDGAELHYIASWTSKGAYPLYAE